MDSLPPPALFGLLNARTPVMAMTEQQRGRDGSEDLPSFLKYKRIYEYPSKMKNHPTPQNTDPLYSFLPTTVD